MLESGKIFSYAGPVDFKKIDQLLKRLKKDKAFLSLGKTTGRRLYAIIVECLENIARHSASNVAAIEKVLPAISVSRQDDKLIIHSTNPVLAERSDRIARRINHVNRLKEQDLLTLYENTINRKSKQGDNGAGLGFILMKLKSGNKLNYRFITIDKYIAKFDLEI